MTPGNCLPWQVSLQIKACASSERANRLRASLEKRSSTKAIRTCFRCPLNSQSKYESWRFQRFKNLIMKVFSLDDWSCKWIASSQTRNWLLSKNMRGQRGQSITLQRAKPVSKLEWTLLKRVAKTKGSLKGLLRGKVDSKERCVMAKKSWKKRRLSIRLVRRQAQ